MSTSKRLSKALRDFLTAAWLDAESFAHSQFAGEGPVKALEDALKAEYQMPYAVGVSSGSAGIDALYGSMALSYNQEIITTPFTMGATIAGALRRGATVVFADVEPDTLCLDPNMVEKVITPRTRAIVPVDALGTPHNQSNFRRLIDRHRFHYFADAAESFGATINGSPASSHADTLVTSFTAGKPLYAGEGGMILTHSKELYKRLIFDTQHAYRQRHEFPESNIANFGHNYRLNPFAALVALHSLPQARQRLAVKQAQSFKIIQLLNETGLTKRITFEQHGLCPSFFRLTASWKGRPAVAKLLQILHEHGYPATIHNLPFGLLTEDPVLKKVCFAQVKVPFSLNVAEREVRRRFCIHLHENNEYENATDPSARARKESTA